MKNVIKSFEKLGIHIPKIYLPNENTDMTKWSVVACDQYTSQSEYWNKVAKLTRGFPSTFNLIYPEVYLDENKREERIKSINRCMTQYLKDGTLKEKRAAFIYVDRKTSRVESRKGLIIALDLERYDYSEGSETLIRATEGTAVDRLPPRIKVRENAVLELPHIMVLIDDPEKCVIEPLADKTGQMEKLYDFNLMMDSGHIKGYMVDDENILDQLAKGLEKLADPDIFKKKYGVESENVLLFAMGDGNHSLASAKAHWENVKKTLSKQEVESHPSRYAMVEMVNIHNEGIVFEPIHRVLFNVNPGEVLESFVQYYEKYGASFIYFDSLREVESKMRSCEKSINCHLIPFVTGSRYGCISIANPYCTLETGSLQEFLDSYLKGRKQSKIDYIHGEDVVFQLSSKEGNIGFLLPVMEKGNFFKTVVKEGVLPRKSFSMGDADEKRFYLECRKIL